jgi:hypothetical protein
MSKKEHIIEIWSPRRISRAAIIGAFAGAMALIPVPTMPGMTLDPAIPAFAAIYYGPFEAYWGYAIGQLIRALILNPGILMINPINFLFGTPFFMIIIAWIIRIVKYPWNIPVGIIIGVLMHMFSYAIPGCIITYGWRIFPICFLLQMIGCLIVITICLLIALGGAIFLWKTRGQPIFPHRFIKEEDKFSIMSKKRVVISAIVAVILFIIPYIFLMTSYGTDEFLGPPESPLRKYIDAYIRHPMTAGLGWLCWELYKKHGEWLKQTE